MAARARPRRCCWPPAICRRRPRPWAPGRLAGPGLLARPWQRPADWAPAPDADVLLVGSGLTAVDLIIELRDRGHRGRIHLVSRRGQMPQPHRVAEARPRPGLQPVALGADLHPRARWPRCAPGCVRPRPRAWTGAT
jgi:hypothetical protein